MNVVLVREKDGFYVDIFGGEDHDRVGPIHPELLHEGDTIICEALLSTPQEKAGPTPPTKRMQKRARKSELRIAADIDGKAQKGSGNQPGAKGDIRKRGEHRIEVKTTTAQQYVLKRSELDKIRGECGQGETASFAIEFINKRTHQTDDRWVCIPYEVWHAAHVNR